MPENRSEHRSEGYAKVVVGKNPGYIRNLTAEGCKIVTFSELDVEDGAPVTVEVIPEETSEIDRISVEAEKRWHRRDESYHVYGFRIASFASPADKEKYTSLVEIYRERD